MVTADSMDALDESMRSVVKMTRESGSFFGAALIDPTTYGIRVFAGDGHRARDYLGHAEINVLRKGRDLEVFPEDCLLLCTAEPCTMCSAAALLTGVRGIAYGTAIKKLRSFGWPQIQLTVGEVLERASGHALSVYPDVLADETDQLYAAGRPATWRTGLPWYSG